MLFCALTALHVQDSLCQGDLLLSFRLVGLGTLPLLQTPHVLPPSGRYPNPNPNPNPGQVVSVDHFFPPGSEGDLASSSRSMRE